MSNFPLPSSSFHLREKGGFGRGGGEDREGDGVNRLKVNRLDVLPTSGHIGCYGFHSLCDVFDNVSSWVVDSTNGNGTVCVCD